MSSNNSSKQSKSGRSTPSNIMDTTDLSTVNSSEINENVQESSTLFDTVYQDRRINLFKELENLQNGKHEKYSEELNKLELQRKELVEKNNMQMQLELDAAEKDYEKECQKIKEDVEKQTKKMRETLIAELNEKRNTILAILNGKKSMELQLNSTDHVPSSSRKHHRRQKPNVGPVVHPKKSLALNNCMLKNNEIKEDLEAIQGSSFSVNATEKKELPQSSSKDIKINTPVTVSNVQIVDGKLTFEKKWFYRGQPIYVEERPDEKFPAIIVSIVKDNISVKKTIDNKIFIINLSRLLNGEVNITRRAL